MRHNEQLRFNAVIQLVNERASSWSASIWLYKREKLSSLSGVIVQRWVAVTSTTRNVCKNITDVRIVRSEFLRYSDSGSTFSKSTKPGFKVIDGFACASRAVAVERSD